MRQMRRVTWSLIVLLAICLPVAIVIWPWVHAGSQVSRKPAAAPQASIAAAPTHLSYPRNPHLPDPRHRMLLGAFTSLSEMATSQAAVNQRQAAMGRRYDLQQNFYNWTDLFPEHGEASIVAAGETPLVIWYGLKTQQAHKSVLGQIINGQDDTWILRQARAIGAFRKLIWLAPMIEMNGDWYHGYSSQPTAFIAAWRHIHDLFKSAGVHNVIWVWTPNITPDNWDQYYPGNAYVNVIGVDGFNNLAWGKYSSFQQIFNPFFAHFAGRKPLMVTETATAAGPSGAAAWISGMHQYLKYVAGPRYGVVAVCWFDTDTSGGHYNWRVDQTPGAWKAWLALAHDAYFGGHPPPAG